MISHVIPRLRIGRRAWAHPGMSAEAAGRMTHFLGTHQNRLDAKGRVSVPAPFRAALRDGAELLRGCNRASAIASSIRASRRGRRANSRRSPRRSSASISSARSMTTWRARCMPRHSRSDIDKEGRIVLPDALIAHAGLHRDRGVHGAWPHLPNLGAASRRRPPRRGARARPCLAASRCRGRSGVVNPRGHIPVMLPEVLRLLAPRR